MPTDGLPSCRGKVSVGFSKVEARLSEQTLRMVKKMAVRLGTKTEAYLNNRLYRWSMGMLK